MSGTDGGSQEATVVIQRKGDGGLNQGVVVEVTNNTEFAMNSENRDDGFT